MRLRAEPMSTEGRQMSEVNKPNDKKKICGHGYKWNECETCGKHPESWG